MSIEQEIKLVVGQVEPLDLKSVDWLQDVVIVEPVEKHLVSTYFDTPEFSLKTFGVGLRLRQVNEQWLQTVKCSGHAVAGLHQRKEWEYPLSEPTFNLDLLRETDLAPLLDDLTVWPRVTSLFTTDFIRQEWQLKLGTSTFVELAYDRGKVIAGDKQSRIHEIELELKSGELEEMIIFSKKLKTALRLEYSDISKAAQGYHMFITC